MTQHSHALWKSSEFFSYKQSQPETPPLPVVEPVEPEIQRSQSYVGFNSFASALDAGITIQADAMKKLIAPELRDMYMKFQFKSCLTMFFSPPAA